MDGAVAVNRSRPLDPAEVGAAPFESEVHRLCEVLQARRRFMDSIRGLLDAAQAPPSDEEIMRVLETVIDGLLDALDAENASLLALDEDADELVFVIARGSVSGSQLSWRHIPAGRGIADWVVRHHRPCIVNDTSEDDRFFHEVDRDTGYRTRSIVAAPMCADGRVVGVVEVLNKRDGHLFTTSDETRVLLAAHLAADLLQAMSARRDGA